MQARPPWAGTQPLPEREERPRDTEPAAEAQGPMRSGSRPRPFADLSGCFPVTVAGLSHRTQGPQSLNHRLWPLVRTVAKF